jgi:hypothetical protein
MTFAADPAADCDLRPETTDARLCIGCPRAWCHARRSVGALKPHIAELYATSGALPATFRGLGLPPPSGSSQWEGDTGSCEDVFGVASDIWTGVEYQPRLPDGYVFVLRSSLPGNLGL